ncbi:MAG: hypothetical protein K8T25_16550 [Planctomycetia bacterium]|nr:hypothetical protein [Planctomycetia bacterium]
MHRTQSVRLWADDADDSVELSHPVELFHPAESTHALELVRSHSATLRLVTDQEFDAPLRRAIGRARQALIEQQQPSGEICGGAIGSAAAQAAFILLRAFLSDGDDQDIRAAGRRLLEWQQADGGWPGPAGARFCLSTSVLAYFALKLSGHAPASEPLACARRVILSHGGAGQIDSAARSWLALFGQIPHHVAATPSIEQYLLPPACPGRALAADRRDDPTLHTRSLVAALGVRRHVPRHVGVRELFLTSPEQWSLPRRTVKSVLRTGIRRWPLRPLRRWALAAARRELLSTIDCWPGAKHPTFNELAWTTIALEALGHVAGTPARTRVDEYLPPLLSSDGETLTVSDRVETSKETALATTALWHSGLDAEHVSLQSAAAWLADQPAHSVSEMSAQLAAWTTMRQQDQRRIRRDNPLPPALQIVGEDFDEDFESDTDNNSDAAAMEPESIRPGSGERAAMIERLTARLVAAQRADGSWSELESVAKKNSAAGVGVRSTADAVKALAEGNLTIAEPAIRRGADWLIRQQRPDGSWHDQSGAIAATSRVVEALAAAEAAVPDISNEEAVAAGVHWLLSHQQPCGGWGDATPSINGPLTSGEGPVTACDTARAVLGLLAAGCGNSEPLVRGVQWLLAAQLRIGSWAVATSDRDSAADFAPCAILHEITAPLRALCRWAEGEGSGNVTSTTATTAPPPFRPRLCRLPAEEYGPAA